MSIGEVYGRGVSVEELSFEEAPVEELSKYQFIS